MWATESEFAIRFIYTSSVTAKRALCETLSKDGTIFLCVEIVDVPGMATLITEANKRGKKPAYPHVDMGWVRCKQFQVMKI